MFKAYTFAILVTTTVLAQDSWDWRQNGVSSPIYEQGLQGHGAMFASITAIEQNYQVKYGKSRQFSTQQIYDCMNTQLNDLTPSLIYENLLKNGALAFAEEYPRSVDSDSCNFHMGLEGIQIVGSPGYESLEEGDELTLLAVLRTAGPITTQINVMPDLLSYRGGIYSYGGSCISSIKQAVVIIGYGIENGVNYWLIQNSWGTTWGEQGFAKILRGANTCGIANHLTLPKQIIDPALEPTPRPFQLILHDLKKTGARCLDGSPAGLYFSKGFGSGKNKTVFYFLGGGWCTGRNPEEVVLDCYNRSSTKLGSTMDWQDTSIGIDHTFSSDPSKDVVFSNWNRIWVIYCDGTGHQGYIDHVLNVNGKDLYFHGYNNTMTHLKWALDKLPPQKTDTFTLYGFSAGGLAVLTWIETFQSILFQKNPQIKFNGLSDSGFIIDFKSLQTQDNDYGIKMKAVTDLVNEHIPLPNQGCMQANPNNQHYCIMAEHLIEFIQSPFYLIQSLYDSWQIQNVLQIECYQGSAPSLTNCSKEDMEVVNSFKNHTAQILQDVYDAQDWVRSVWSPSCVFHGNQHFGNGTTDADTNLWQVPMSSGNNLGKTLYGQIYSK